uniref:Uncharacterized protein n=1 Tax=Nelumbo nucifera TaxID=4432 RepID=A0A822Y8T7_NELNU|nr:TPA_asm: hypothetical protein HUJ06_009325 [Nelumbo nucifera]
MFVYVGYIKHFGLGVVWKKPNENIIFLFFLIFITLDGIFFLLTSASYFSVFDF